MLSLLHVATAFGVAMLAVVVAVPVVRILAKQVGAIDHPGGRRIHVDPVPRLGGVAVVLALVAGVTVAVGRSPLLNELVGSTPLRWIGLGAAGLLMLLVGIGDDLRSLRAEWKLVAELAAGLAVAGFFPVESIDFGFFVLPASASLISAVIVVLWVATVTNAYNMIDGMDGLAGGVGAIAAAAMAAGAWQLGNDAAALGLVAVSGALTAFLLYNGHPAKIFLGDAGSLPIGFLLGSLGVIGFSVGGSWYAVPAIIALFVPLVDLLTAVVRRFMEALHVVRHDDMQERFELNLAKKPGLFTPDGRHIHHRLLSLGVSRRGTVLTLYSLGFTFALLSLASGQLRGVAPVAFVLFVAVLAYVGSRWLYEELQIFRRGVLLPLFETRFARSRLVHAAFDFAGLMAAFIGARALIGFDWHLPLAGELFLVRSLAAAATGLAVYWVIGIYQISFRRAGQWVLFRAILAVGGATIGSASVDTLVFAEPLRWSSWLLTGYLGLTFTILPRLTYRLFDSIHQRAREDGRRVVIFGAGRGGTMTLRELLENPKVGFMPVAFVDDNPALWHKVIEGYTVYPGGARLKDSLTELAVDSVLVSSGKLSDERCEQIRDICDSAGIGTHRVQLIMQETAHLGEDPDGDATDDDVIELVELRASG